MTSKIELIFLRDLTRRLLAGRCHPLEHEIRHHTGKLDHLCVHDVPSKCPVSLSLTCNWRAWKAPVAFRHRCPCTCPGGRTINIDFHFEIMFLLRRASYLCCFSFSTINTRAAGRFPPRAVFPGSSRSLFPLPFRYRMPWRQQRLVLSFKSWNNAISPWPFGG